MKDAIRSSLDRVSGLLFLGITVAVVADAFDIWHLAGPIGAALSLVVLAVLSVTVGGTGRIFLGVGVALIVGAEVWGQDPLGAIETALERAAFIAAFFTALTSLRFAADTSPSITRAGRFLAAQPPGRRYLALTLGGQMFALLLNYGAIALLGSLATASTRDEPEPERRRLRLKRMLLAIQRGFISTLPWSPLGFAIAISTTVIPGANWADAAPYCLASGIAFAGVGYALDQIFKPRLTGIAPAIYTRSDGWSVLLPLLALLGILAVLVIVLQSATGLRPFNIVMFVVPAIAGVWVMLQAKTAPLRALAQRSGRYLFHDLPAYRRELVLLMMAGFIGSLGSVLLTPLIEASGIDLGRLPPWVILTALVWLIPLTGQIGMNPILAVTLFIPALPAPEAIEVSPIAYVVAITGGWAISGMTSPFTATTLLVGGFAGVSARHAGLVWNGWFALIMGVLYSIWASVLTLL
ncbi:hypothetical protein [Anianabacter salinae]|uniref:hypothetical protein n=1 Tax=Anianabacter salinae TaxID=2851023 RepID=UPI00225E2963|nr:hypothetical protein [Anianabacter salinae]MBV0912078.1 hypothetical protein [Anianabacter salinae]